MYNKQNLLEGDDFKKIQKKAKKLGAKSLNYSKRNIINISLNQNQEKKFR